MEKYFFQHIKKFRTLPTNTDLYIHIMYFNSSKIFKFLGQFWIGARMHVRLWAHSWFNRALHARKLRNYLYLIWVLLIDEMNISLPKLAAMHQGQQLQIKNGARHLFSKLKFVIMIIKIWISFSPVITFIFPGLAFPLKFL